MDYGIRNICAIGTGTMNNTSLPYAMAGYRVFHYGSQPESIVRAEHKITDALKELQHFGLINAHDIPDTLGRYTFTTSLEEAACKADYVIESGIETPEEKHKIFRNLDAICPEHTILGTNSSSLLVSEIAGVVSPARQKLVLGVHGFNPPHLESLIEVIRGKETSDHTMDVVSDLMDSIGKDPVRLEKEVRGGFINRIQTVVLREMFHLAENGIVRLEGADAAMKILGRRWLSRGPALVAYFGGYDIFEKIANNVGPDLNNEPRAHAMLSRNVAAGHTGKKSGSGGEFYSSLNGEDVERIGNAWNMVLLETLRDRKIGLIGSPEQPGVVRQNPVQHLVITGS